MLVLLFLSSALAQGPIRGPVLPEWFPTSSNDCSSPSGQTFRSITSKIFLPEGGPKDICIKFPGKTGFVYGPGLEYKENSCSEGCCFYIPANSKKVQEVEAEFSENGTFGDWFKAKDNSCDSPSNVFVNSREILNKDQISGNRVSLCIKKRQDPAYNLITGEAVDCVDKCCFFVHDQN